MKSECGLPTQALEAEAALAGVRTIAVVGLSPKPEKPSHQVAAFLQQQGYRIVPIYPGVDRILGEKAYASLADYGQPVDMVDIFRKPDAVPAIVQQAIAIGCQVVWMQEGISHESAAEQARAAGLKVVQNRCSKKILLSILEKSRPA